MLNVVVVGGTSLRGVEHWARLPREVMESTRPLESFKTHLDVVILSNLL